MYTSSVIVNDNPIIFSTDAAPTATEQPAPTTASAVSTSTPSSSADQVLSSAESVLG